MPEFPDVVVYIERLSDHFTGVKLGGMRIASPWLLRSVQPSPEVFAGRRVDGFRRLGKRIVMEFEGELFAVLHLMIGGRLRWRDPGTAIPKKRGLAAFDFPQATILLTEEGTKKRASLHLVEGDEGLADHQRSGIEPLDASLAQFVDAIRAERHTLKRSLTDARLFSGIGGAYADEIMHRARLSPMARTDRLSDEDIARLHDGTHSVLSEWVDRLRDEVGDGFPEKVTAFHTEMAVHGKHGEPCPVCGAPIQRIRYASRETNYCPGCQTEGRILADRALSRILKEDWPRTLEELE